MSRISNVVLTSYDEPDKLLGYKYSARCTLCKAQDRNDQPLRDALDNYAMSHTNKECVTWLLDRGINVSEKVVAGHITKHAPYVALAKATGTKKMQKMIVKIHQSKTEVSTAVQRIIDIGDAKVQEGDMPVTEKLYVEALKIQSKAGNKSSMDTEFEVLDADFINKVKQLNGNAT